MSFPIFNKFSSFPPSIKHRKEKEAKITTKGKNKNQANIATTYRYNSYIINPVSTKIPKILSIKACTLDINK